MFNTNYTSWDYWKDYTPAFDPANRDKIAVMDFGDYPILIMAQHAGINPYVKLDNSEINEIRMVLRHLFENTRLLVGDLTLLQKGLVDGSIATGVGCGNYCVSGARYGGHMEITSRVPEPLDNGFKRGAIWLEATAIVTEPNNPEAAQNWIKWCADTEVCKILSLGDITSPPTPNKRVEALYSEEEKDIIMTDYMWEAWNNSLFQTMMPDVDELLAIFQEEWARAS
jgi:spermidine/putrescine transport system substrate-binding protein